MSKFIYCVVPGGTQAYGGMSRFSRYYSVEWARRKYTPEIRIVDSYGPGSRWKMPLYYVRALGIILSGAFQNKIAILHIQMAERLSVVRKGILIKIARAFNIPVVLHLHAAEFESYVDTLSPNTRRFVEKVFGQSDRVVTLGSSWSRYMEKGLGVSPAQIVTIHNGVPDPETVNNLRDQNDICQILFLGALSKRKGTMELIEALEIVNRKGSSWHCVLAGNGDASEFIRAAKQMGIAEKIEFYGWATEEQSKKLLRSSDILVLPSHNEGLPLAILEAMSFGLAIVSTPVGAIPDAVESGRNGVLVPVGDKNALADALHGLVTDVSVRHRYQIESRKSYIQKFRVSLMVDKLHTMFSELLGR